MPPPCATTTTFPARKQSRASTTVPALIAFVICALARKHIQAEVLAAVSVVERHLASWPPERAHELRLAEVRVICRLCTPDLLGERRRPLGPAEVTGFVEAHHHREHLRLP